MGGCHHIPGVTCDNCRTSESPRPSIPTVRDSYFPMLDQARVIPPPSPSKPWQRCPVCDGVRVVPEDFYPDDPPWAPGETREVEDKYRTCLTCMGAGMVQHA